ncbi:VMAP-C domain-containing protein [Streptomyces sp. SID1121]|uniref:VMAP-C domain-containing protein n=1 Tax=Streptomyces sp. SID1121 TaxID=3425888 RepID=UPI004055F378
MDGANGVDPARIHAVAVGLEAYPRHPGWSLAGASADALRFARWLRKGGVPGENIELLLAPVEGSLPELDAQADAADVTWRQVASRDQLMDAFTGGLDGRTGDALYVFWGSHGFLDHGDRRLLLCPDASLNDKRCIDATDLREHLARADLPGFSRQLFFFDACATFLEHLHQPAGPAVARFPRAPRREQEQFVLHAAARGQVAENDAERRAGVFSHVVNDWLEGHAVDLRPDLVRLVEHVKGRFAKLHAAGGPLQTPTSLYVRALDGSEEMLTPPAPRRAVAPGSLDQVALALRNTLTDAEHRRRCVDHVVAGCGVAGSLPRDSDETFAEVLLTVPRAMAALTEVVFPKDRGAADTFLSLARSQGAPGLLSPGEHVVLSALADGATPLPSVSVTAAAVRMATPMGGAWLPPTEGESYESCSAGQFMAAVHHLEERLGGLSVQHGGTPLVPAVVRFTEHMAAAAPPVLRAGLREWGDRVAERLGVRAGGLHERRADADAWAAALDRSARPPRVLVQLDVDSASAGGGGVGVAGGGGEIEGVATRNGAACPDLYTCAIWVDTGTGELVRSAGEHSAPLTPSQVVSRIERAIHELHPLVGGEPMVEVLLQPDALHLPVETWDGADPFDPVPNVLGVERATVVRSAPLASPDGERRRRAQLRHRWAGRAGGKVVYLDDRHAEGRAAYGALKADSEASRVVVRAGTKARANLVQLALHLGYPVVLWDRRATEAVPPPHFDPLGPGDSAERLPGRVRDYRARVCDDPEAHPVRPALLFEDEDRPLPPVLSLTELSESREVSS